GPRCGGNFGDGVGFDGRGAQAREIQVGSEDFGEIGERVMLRQHKASGIPALTLASVPSATPSPACTRERARPSEARAAGEGMAVLRRLLRSPEASGIRQRNGK